MTPSLEIYIYCLIGLYDLVVLIMLAFLFRHREHQAIQLAQGSFLACLLVAALVGGTFTFTFIPEKSWYCMCRGPLVLFPFTLMGAILVARLWRVYVTLSGVMQLGRNNDRKSSVGNARLNRLSQIVDYGSWNMLHRTVSVLSFLAKIRLPTFVRSKQKATNNAVSHFRQTATGAESAQLVVFLMIPQLLLQTIGLAVYAPSLEFVVGDSGFVGRYFCTRSFDWVYGTGFLIAALTYGLAVIMAWQGRDFPSIFNEKDAICNTGAIAAVVITVSFVSCQERICRCCRSRISNSVFCRWRLRSQRILPHHLTQR